MSVSLVRTIISDPIQYGTSSAAGDGFKTDFLLPYSPVYPSTAKVHVNDVAAVFTIDEALGLITLAVAPAYGASIHVSVKYSLLSDAQIQSILDLHDGLDGQAKLAAADCLDIIASSEALILKRIKNLDLDTDGPSVAKSLREHAKALRESALLLVDTEPSWDFAEQVLDHSGFIEKVTKDELREE